LDNGTGIITYSNGALLHRGRAWSKLKKIKLPMTLPPEPDVSNRESLGWGSSEGVLKTAQLKKDRPPCRPALGKLWVRKENSRNEKGRNPVQIRRVTTSSPMVAWTAKNSRESYGGEEGIEIRGEGENEVKKLAVGGVFDRLPGKGGKRLTYGTSQSNIGQRA